MEYDACFLGRITPLKGIYDLVDIWEMVVKKKPNATVAMMGAESENYLPTLKAKIQKKFLERNIFILGSVSEEQKKKIMKSSKLFVSPSHEEGWGIAVLEAMSCGLPVIAYDLPAYKIFSNAMIRIPLNKKDKFARKIIKLIDDTQKRITMGVYGVLRSSIFNWKDIAKKDLWTAKSILKD